MKFFPHRKNIAPTKFFLLLCVYVQNMMRECKTSDDLIKIKNQWIKLIVQEYDNDPNCQDCIAGLWAFYDKRLDDFIAATHQRIGTIILNRVIF